MIAPIPWHEYVKGVSIEEVRKRYPDAPTKLTEQWCKENLWWWQNLSRGSLPKLPNQPPRNWRKINGSQQFERLEKIGAADHYLLLCEVTEWAARVNGLRLPPPLEGDARYLAHLLSAKKISLDGLFVTSAHSKKEVINFILYELKARGWTEGKGFNPQKKRTMGRRNWPKMFTAIEWVDRYYLLGERWAGNASKNVRRTINERYDRPVRTPLKGFATEERASKSVVIRGVRKKGVPRWNPRDDFLKANEGKL